MTSWVVGRDPGAGLLGRAVPRRLLQPSLSRGWSAGVMGILLAATAALTVADVQSDPHVNLSVLYLLPPLVAAMLLGAAPAVVLSACAAAAWAVGEPAVAGQPPPALHAVDAAIRFLASALLVVLVDGLRRARARAVESDRRARDFVELAAHQMRTPVAAVRAAAETLVSMGAEERQEPFLQDLAVESARIGRLVNNLLWVARLDGGAAYPVRDCDPVTTVRAAAARVEARRPDLEVEVTSGSAGTARLAEDVLRETVANLLDNATRHARSRIEVTVQSHTPDVRVTVADDGPGLTPGREREAFERFVSFDGGVGLGLPLCRDAARRMGGDLVYRAGAFELRLPAGPATEADVGSGPTTTAPSSRPLQPLLLGNHGVGGIPG